MTAKTAPKPKRSRHGKIALILFWAFNIVMLGVTVLMLIGITNVLSDPPEAVDLLPGAENVVMGAAVALGVTLFLWGFGAAMLGFWVYFTRPNRTQGAN